MTFSNLTESRMSSMSEAAAVRPRQSERHREVQVAFQPDSSRLGVVPDIISLSCVQDAIGGHARLVSMSRIYEFLALQSHEVMDRLHQSYVHAIVKPGN